MKVKLPDFYVPELLSEPIVDSVEFISNKIGITPIFGKVDLDFFTMNHAYDISLAKSVLGYKPIVSLEKGIKQMVDWYKEVGAV